MEIISVILYPVFYYPDHLSHFSTYQYSIGSILLEKDPMELLFATFLY